MIIPSRRHALPVAIAAAAAIVGTIAALHYHRLGLTLSHYDARGHLAVARRIIDSITPGWQQIGAVWLPVPHLLNALPVQIDFLYRTGLSGVAISVAAFAVATGAIAWIVLALTDSAIATVVASLSFALNPNVLYLQATPMTEPLLLALTTLAVALLVDWANSPVASHQSPVDGNRQSPVASRQSTTVVSRQSAIPSHRRTAVVGWAFALACLTRYEAWPVTVCALLAAVWVRWRHGDRIATACRQIGLIAVYPALAIAAFAAFSRVVIGEWLFAGGFFVPENKALGRPLVAAAEIWWGTHMLSGYAMVGIGAVGLAGLLVTALARRPRADRLIVLSLVAMAALPWWAFMKGHPFRIRYMGPLIAIEAVGVGAAVALVTRARVAAALLVLLALVSEIHPMDSSAPMVVEAQWDRPNVPLRQHVTDCLRAGYDGETIMASMGSLGHYMQETARSGFDIRSFLHEGNGDIWLKALEGPRQYAGWLLVDEQAEGGDILATIARRTPAFLDGYARVCEGAGVALYRRQSSVDSHNSPVDGSHQSAVTSRKSTTVVSR